MSAPRRLVAGSLMLFMLAACSDSQSTAGPDSNAADSTPTVSTDGRKVVEWRWDGERPPPEAQQFEVQVAWIACTGAAKPEDPQPVVEYGDKTVTLTVWAIPPEGKFFTCPGNPSVPVTVTLDEPLGDRAVVHGQETPY